MSPWTLARPAIVLGVLASAAPARADLGDDAARVARMWSDRGARVERLAPVFVEHGRRRRLTLPPEPGGPGEKGCTTVALLAVRTAEFMMSPVAAGVPAPPPLGPTPRAPAPPGEHSAGGAATLARCGAARAEIGRVALELVSSRAAVEIVVARSEAPLAGVGEILPERAEGTLAPRGDPGGPLEPGPIAERVARAERRARADGAVEVTRTVVHAGETGAGQADLALPGGCHRIDLMAEVPARASILVVFPRRVTDVDAEAHDASGRFLARDRADVPDARLDFCLGEAGRVSIPFSGAAGPVAVTLSDARWPLPAHLPARWGTRARGGLAGALFRRRAPAPEGPPVFETFGGQGSTLVPVPLVPGRCYLAVLATLRGEARFLRLGATVGDRSRRDDALDRPEGVAVSFCAEREEVARLVTEVRGNAVWWGLAVWPMGSVP